MNTFSQPPVVRGLLLLTTFGRSLPGAVLADPRWFFRGCMSDVMLKQPPASVEKLGMLRDGEE